jgi:hypothetical protein
MTAIQPGQEYESCHPLDEGRRIRVLSVSGYGRATVVTLTGDGREARQRPVNTRHLHDSGLTRDGQPRRTGYRLVRNADGSPA